VAIGTNRESVRILRTLLESYQLGAYSQLLSTPEEPRNRCGLIAQARLSSSTVRAWLLLSLVGGATILLVAGIGASVLFVVGAVGMIGLRIWRRAHVNRRAIDRDLPALLTSVASSVRAGIDPLSALINARNYFSPETPLMQEVERIRDGLAKGGDEEELLESFLTTYESQEGELFKRCLILSRRHGSSLAEPLHRITKVVRQRQSFRRKIRAALAMHRMSAIGIALCAVAMTALQLGMNPHAFDVALQHPTGGKLLLGGGSLIITGVMWMMLMGREASSR